MISSIRHPFFQNSITEWEKWRIVYEGGELFRDRYLEKTSKSEDNCDFKLRKNMTPIPSFSKAAIDEVKNSIFQHMVGVSRRDGPDSYQNAITGEDFGVDFKGSSMNSFMGQQVLPELLVMGRVGIFVDSPETIGTTLRDSQGIKPYLYRYQAEDILSWSMRPGRPDEFDAVLLKDFVEVKRGLLPSETIERFRFIFIGDDGKVHIQFFKMETPEASMVPGNPTITQKVAAEIQIDAEGSPTDQDIILDMDIIPFIIVELSHSLMADIADHQIALLNLESLDINFAIKSNTTFYVEQQDERSYSPHIAGPADPNASGTAAEAGSTKEQVIQFGSTAGRIYGKGLDRPEFIHPSAEPLTASIEKQEKLKQDIRRLLHLAVSTVVPQTASAESKQLDQCGLEAGLSNIGLALEHAERKIALYWTFYHIDKVKPASIKYPEKYNLKSDDDRRKDAASLQELRNTIPSGRFQKSISKEIARIVLESKISKKDLNQIFAEIDAAEAFSADPKTIFESIESGVLCLCSAAQLLGYPKDEPDKAATDHATRLARIAQSQSNPDLSKGLKGARGLEDFSGQPGTEGPQEKKQSRDTTTEVVVTDNTRGEAQ